MAEVAAELEREYCPPLDPALFTAIVLDFDLVDEAGLGSARSILDQLKESAIVEEVAGFDPSGTGGADLSIERRHGSVSCPETGPSTSYETDLTSLSNRLTSLDVSADVDSKTEDTLTPESLANIERLSEEEKMQALHAVFGEQLNAYTIRYTLRKCNGRYDTTVEELLNHVYFGESAQEDGHESVPTKSVDAFSEDNALRRGRKAKAKPKTTKQHKQRRSSSLPSSANGDFTTGTNRWQSAAQDIDFIASRSGIAPATVSSRYYAKGASVPQTIGDILKKSMHEPDYAVDDATAAEYARELGVDFPTIAPEYLLALIRLTYPSTTAAHELAKALTRKPHTSNSSGIQVIAQYNPPDGILPTTSTPTARAYDYLESSDTETFDPAAAAARRTAYALAKERALTQASAAHRKAKSDRLMGGAAAYYGQVGREFAALSARATAANADAIAATQSSPTELDLHGIDVLNAVRIASKKVGQWWGGMGESRVNGRLGAEDRSMGYRIIVGLGRHSEGGKGKLGPAVSKALREQGWRVEAAGAVVLVKGPMKK